MQGSGNGIRLFRRGCIYLGLDVSWVTSGRKRGKVDGKRRRDAAGVRRIVPVDDVVDMGGFKGGV